MGGILVVFSALSLEMSPNDQLLKDLLSNPKPLEANDKNTMKEILIICIIYLLLTSLIKEFLKVVSIQAKNCASFRETL